ncbi:MAG: hypothetical protein COY40_02515 [Alphaproteobacteria bacterium CG_4_10_14_0_8_um_filter_53_9]|nr:MAG: hypothetical protein COY40_02515 [Alphaproteobacteria bacterium CG_4_10_14_0_8_um_filter_53_9]
MSWHQTLTQTLAEMESLTNPGTENELKKLTELGDKLVHLTGQIPALPQEEKDEVRPHLPKLGERIQLVISALDAAKSQTAASMQGLRNRAQAAAAYQTKR